MPSSSSSSLLAENGNWTKNSQWHHVSGKGIPVSFAELMDDYLEKMKKITVDSWSYINNITAEIKV